MTSTLPPRHDATGASRDRDVHRPWFTGLDSIRFVAAFLVLVHHSGFSSGATFRWAEDGGVVGQLIARLDIGVTVFFVLSGFVLFRPFVADQFADRPIAPLRPFWARRVARIFPAYWAAFLIQLVFGAIIVEGLTGFALSFSLLHIYSPDYVFGGMTQAWTLSTEIGFYLLLPLIASAARRWSSSPTADGTARAIPAQAGRLLLVCGALMVSSVLFRVATHLVSPWQDRGLGGVSRLWTFSHLDSFGFGMALAVCSVWAAHRPFVRRSFEAATRAIWIWWAAAVSALWWVSTQFDLGVGLELAGFEREVLRQTLYLVVAAAIITPVVLSEPRSNAALRFLERPMLVFLGGISYGVYLWHVAFMAWTHDVTGWPDLTGNFFVFLAVATIGSVAAGTLSLKYVENPAMRAVRARLGGPST